MSVGICRLQKFTAGSVKGIEIHDQREKEGVSHTNPDIDWSRTALNFDLQNKEKISFYRQIKERIESLQLPKAVRKDAIVMVGCIITSDSSFFKSITQEQTAQYFKDSYEFFKQRYGAENVISATVHVDEKTPHLHLNFVPITNDGRLSAKDIMTRIELKQLQTDFHLEVGQKYGLSRGSEGSTAEHLETAELKRKTLQHEISTLEAQIKPVQDAIACLSDIQRIEGKKTALGGKIALTEDEFNLLKAQAENGFKTKHNLEIQFKNLQVENNDLHLDNQNLQKNFMPLWEKNRELQQMVKKLQSVVDRVHEVFSKNSEFKEAYIKAQNQLEKDIDLSLEK